MPEVERPGVKKVVVLPLFFGMDGGRGGSITLYSPRDRPFGWVEKFYETTDTLARRLSVSFLRTGPLVPSGKKKGVSWSQRGKQYSPTVQEEGPDDPPLTRRPWTVLVTSVSRVGPLLLSTHPQLPPPPTPVVPCRTYTIDSCRHLGPQVLGDFVTMSVFLHPW